MTILTRWDPAREYSAMQDRMNRRIVFSVSRTALKARRRR